MIMKLGMEHYVLKLYKVYINDDPELILTHFKTMSNLAKLVFVLIVGPDIRQAFTGPLVHWFLVRFWVAEWPPFGKELQTRFTICSLCVMIIFNFRYFSF